MVPMMVDPSTTFSATSHENNSIPNHNLSASPGPLDTSSETNSALGLLFDGLENLSLCDDYPVQGQPPVDFNIRRRRRYKSASADSNRSPGHILA